MLRDNIEWDTHRKNKTERDTARDRKTETWGRKREADRCRLTCPSTHWTRLLLFLSNFPLLVRPYYNVTFHVSQKSKQMMNKEVTFSILPLCFLCYRGELRNRENQFPHPTWHHRSSEWLAVGCSRSSCPGTLWGLPQGEQPSAELSQAQAVSAPWPWTHLQRTP